MDIAEPNAVPEDSPNRFWPIVHRFRHWTLRLLLLVAIVAAVLLAFGLGSGDIAADQGIRYGIAVLLLSSLLWASFWFEERSMKKAVSELLEQQRRLSEAELVELANGLLEPRSLRYVLAQMHREGTVDCLREKRPGGGSHRVFFRTFATAQSSTQITRKTVLADPN